MLEKSQQLLFASVLEYIGSPTISLALALARDRVGNFPCLEWQACPRGRDIESLKCSCETHAARVPARFEF